jgi:type I restriction enzyme S subunit
VVAVSLHWEILTIKRIGSIRYGIGEPPVYKPDGVPLIRATNVHAGKLFEQGLVYVDPDDIPEKRIVWLSPGDIVVVRSGAYTGDSAIIPDGYGECIAGFDMVFRCKVAEPQFLQFALLSVYLKSFQIDLLKLRAAQPHLNAEELGNCTVVIPPRAEQVLIIDFLKKELDHIDMLESTANDAMQFLTERRSALISAAVTGKIDVRGFVPAQPGSVAA